MGRRVMRLPVNVVKALVNAGGIGGIGGSPDPVCGHCTINLIVQPLSSKNRFGFPSDYHK